MKGEIMEYTVDEERSVYGKVMENIDCYCPEDSDDLRLARGIFNGLIIELAAAIFLFVVVAAI
jgi:hypothetical protein